ncbi:winged helix-turn-helix transcriptional regulator [Agrococcus jejuensis]|uniref:winged helix-turn-helix transcriptional regulator n=1 Tax=Agrococcus jejuensis TaxID=399736 RepID=UPI00119FADBD|nr:helix-turn-helix domain-containing protein [Agrococcus jejuensis]
MAARSYGQHDGVTRALELVGDRWALLVVRDLLVGPRRYGDLRAGLPRIPTNILATRLAELVEAGVAVKTPVKRMGTVYELTALGRELEPIVLGLARWGMRSLAEPAADDVVTSDALATALRAAFVPGGAAFVADVLADGVALRVRVAGDRLDVATVALERPETGEAGAAARALRDLEPDAVLRATHALQRALAGTAAIDGTLTLVEGDPSVGRAFAAAFAA